MITTEQVIEEIRNRIKRDYTGLHKDWTDNLLMMVDNVEIVTNEVNSQEKPSE